MVIRYPYTTYKVSSRLLKPVLGPFTMINYPLYHRRVCLKSLNIWCLHVPQLNHLDFLFGNFSKTCMHTNKPATIPELKNDVIPHFMDIPAEMCARLCWVFRAQISSLNGPKGQPFWACILEMLLGYLALLLLVDNYTYSQLHTGWFSLNLVQGIKNIKLLHGCVTYWLPGND